jgi:pimeloyl-ACP methyl ester carboxylesterase
MPRRRAIDHPLLTSRAFFPRAPAVAEPFEVRARGAALRCWRAAPHPAAPTVIHFHGNGEIVADYLPGFADLILGLGVNLVLAEYRGYGGSSGTPSLSALLDDAEAVLEATGLPPARVIPFGRSLGSYPAIHLAGRHRVAALIVESGIADPMERILVRVAPEELGVTREELAAEVAELLDPEPKLARHRAPILVLHAIEDSMIDATHAVRLASWAASQHRELVLLPRGDHNDVFAANQAAYVRALRELLTRL